MARLSRLPRDAVLQNWLAPSHADSRVQHLFDQPLLPGHTAVLNRD
ncbi:hypothetical protein PAAG_12629 [Paracoccidioides lutzii Pb01]|uniref:Uncharacterized protein n=1 Tax=Paracoccidioides lutzii (strain ATCC MYA-826 / Pb01) TaxID=502779 RepID=A0A0A2UYR6_PARBA|nr:hypothetical protein PAAG_12629 [Paracoccidioides lutzii Pb01]KGQ00696.1 hypothetical protein PAAG_12629 [Paracoccidioides lutzii Pb01]